MLDVFFTVEPSLTGDVFSTDFYFKNTTTSSTEKVLYTWDFGDGNNTYDIYSPTHTYRYPGTYTVTLTAQNSDDEINVHRADVSVDYPVRDYIKYVQIPESFADPGKPTKIPFKIEVASSQYEQPLIIDLYASNSKSIPEQFIEKRWTFLAPTWKFLDKNYNFVTSLTAEPTPIYKNSRVVGVSSTAEFYFIDAKSNGSPDSTCPPLIITASLKTDTYTSPKDSNTYKYQSFANNKQTIAAIVWHVNNTPPTHLKVTGNYIAPIYPHQWKDVKVPILITVHSNRSYILPGGEDRESEVLFTYPATNSDGLYAPILLSSTYIQPSSLSVDESPLYFKSEDENGFSAGGYVFTTVTYNEACSGTTLYATTTAAFSAVNTQANQFNYPEYYSPNSFVWVSNPNTNTLNRITLLPFLSTCSVVNEYKERGILTEGYVAEIDVPELVSDSTFNYTLTGGSNIYGLAIDPRNYELIACDGDTDRIYKFSTNGTLLSTVSLSGLTNSTPTISSFTPAGVSIDSDYNIWVTLFNAVSVLKFDKNLNLLFSTQVTGIPLSSTFDGDFLLKPPAAETDSLNNCWVTYAHPLCSILAKFNSNGSLIKQIPLQPQTTPTSLAVDINNNIWVTNFDNTSTDYGSIQLYNTTTYTLLSNITTFKNPTNISIDRNNNIWFSHDIRNIGTINTKTGETSAWYINPDLYESKNLIFLPQSFTPTLIPGVGRDDEQISGLAVDVYNRVWILDGYNNTAIVIPASNYITPDTIYSIKITPNPSNIFYPNIISGTTMVDTTTSVAQPIQAAGDWTGNKWYQKYTRNSNFVRELTGRSTPFSIFELNNPNQIRRVNETFNTANYLKQLALPETLKLNSNLFDKLLADVVGTGETNSLDLGQVCYERIANFSSNHSDIDTCNVPQLISHAKSVNIPYQEFLSDTPSEIVNAIDIGSIPRTKLWGIPDTTPILTESIGAQLTDSHILTADIPIVLLNKFDSSYTILNVPPSSNNTNTAYLTTYQLSSFEPPGYLLPLLFNYQAFEYTPVYSGNFIENIIDWASEQTTLAPHLSTYQEWYGDDGVLEKTFNYLLTKNLFTK
jgi:PKD repeat protein